MKTIRKRLDARVGWWTALAFSTALALGPAVTQPVKMPTGDLHPQHLFAGTSEPANYRLYVPTSYDPHKAYPLVVVLHGSGEDENSPFDRSDLRATAEKRGYILLAPFGHRRGGFGNIYPVVVTRETAASLPSPDKPMPAPGTGPQRMPIDRPVPADDFFYQTATRMQPDFEAAARAEAETMNVLALVRSQYRVDSARIYLMGNSMGGLGTTYLAARYPEIWAAIAPSGGPVAAWSYPFWRLRQYDIAALFVHGELDEHANPHWSQLLADTAKAEGVDATALIVRGGRHNNGWSKVLSQTFDFFDRHVKRKR